MKSLAKTGFNTKFGNRMSREIIPYGVKNILKTYLLHKGRVYKPGRIKIDKRTTNRMSVSDTLIQIFHFES